LIGQRPFTSSHDGKVDTPVEIKLLKNTGGYLLFLINHGDSKEKVTTLVQIEKEGEYNITDLIGNEKMKSISFDSQFKIQTVIKGRDVKVLTIQFKD
jgi:hypothetical protein